VADELASDVTLEGSILDGAVKGVDAVHTVIGAALGCMTARTSTSSDVGKTTASSRTTPSTCAAYRPGPSM